MGIQRKNTTGRYQPPLVDRLSEEQLKALDIELEGFRDETTKTVLGVTHTFHPVNLERWLKHKGALSKKDGSAVISNYFPGKYDDQGRTLEAKDCDPILYEQLMEDFEQWNRWHSKTDIMWRERMKGYEDMVGSGVIQS